MESVIYFLKYHGIRALDKRENFDDNFSYFSSKPYVVTPHLNRLEPSLSDEGSHHTVLCRINKIYPKLLPNTPSYLELLSCDLA